MMIDHPTCEPYHLALAATVINLQQSGSKIILRQFRPPLFAVQSIQDIDLPYVKVGAQF